MDDRTSFALLAGCAVLAALFALPAGTSLAQALRAPYAPEPGAADVRVSRVDGSARGAARVAEHPRSSAAGRADRRADGAPPSAGAPLFPADVVLRGAVGAAALQR